MSDFSIKNNFRIADCIYFVLSVLFLLGSIFLFNTCAPKDDGSWMTCHWAGNIVTGLAAVLCILALAINFVSLSVKKGIYFASLLLELFTAFVPGKIIHLCMMSEMKCNALSKPCVIVFSLILAVYSLLNLFSKTKSKIKSEEK